MILTVGLRSSVLLAMLAFVGVASGAELSQWAASYDPVAKTRYIPVELWTGAEWDGSRELKMAPADFSFGKRSEKRISGPLAWKRPGTGETIQVYERDNRGLACELRIVALKLRPDLLRCRALPRLGALRGPNAASSQVLLIPCALPITSV